MTDRSMGTRLLAWRIPALIAAAYALRPFSLLMTLEIERRVVGDPHRSVDMHTFGFMGALLTSLLLAPIVLPMIWNRRSSAGNVPRDVRRLRSRAVLAVIGTPLLMQASYLDMIMDTTQRIEMAVPLVLSSVLWFVIVLRACSEEGTTSPSIHAAFEWAPRLVWTSLISIGLLKIGFLLVALSSLA